MKDLTGIQDSSQRIVSEPHETHTISPHTVPIDFQAYDGLDSLGNVDLIPQQIFPKPVYEINAQIPKLVPPQPEEEELSEPYEMAKRNLILQSYFDRLQKLLDERADISDEESSAILKALRTGKPIKPLSLAQLALPLINQTKKEIREQAHLPQSWEPLSHLPQDWTPLPVSDATKIQQVEIDLSSILAPGAVNQARATLILTNITEFFIDMEKAGQKTSLELPPASLHHVAMVEFIKVMAQVLRDLKEILREIQLKDTDASEQGQKRKMEAVQSRLRAMEEFANKQAEILKKQSDAQHTSEIMKWVGIGISALALAVSVVVTVMTFGAAAPLAVGLAMAGLAVSLAMTTYSVVDSFTGTTQKLVESIKESIATTFAGDPELQKAMQYLFLAVVVAVLIASIVLGGTGAASIAVTSVAGQAIKEAVKILAVQVLIMTIMASNVLPEVFGKIVRACGVSENDSKTWEIVLTIITMLIIMVAATLGGKGISMDKITEGFKSAGRSIKSFAEKLSQGKEVVTRELQLAMQKLEELIMALIAKLKVIPGQIGKTAAQAGESFIDVGRGLKSLKDLALDPFINRGKASPFSLALASQKLLELSRDSMHIADGINRGILGLELEKLSREVGLIKESEEMLQAIVQLVDKMLAYIQSGMDTRSEEILALQRAFSSFYSNMSRNTTKIFQTLQG